MSEIAERDDELLPCPFCGGQAELLDYEDADNGWGSCVQCKGCHASTAVEFERKENFASNWNRRQAAARIRDLEGAETPTLEDTVRLFAPDARDWSVHFDGARGRAEYAREAARTSRSIVEMVYGFLAPKAARSVLDPTR